MDARYLKLDASNDPLTGQLAIGDGVTDIAQPFKINASLVSDWYMTSNVGTFFGGHQEEIMQFGWNVTGGSGSRAVAGESSLYTAIETDYYTDATNHYMEWYVEYFSEDGLTTRRPFQTSINRVDHVVTTFITGTLQFYNSAGTVKSSCDNDGNWTYYSTAVNYLGGDVTIGPTANSNFSFRANNQTYFTLLPAADAVRWYKDLQFVKGSSASIGTGDSYDLILTRAGAAKFTIGSATATLADALYVNSTSTTALQVGTSNLIVDTTNNLVGVNTTPVTAQQFTIIANAATIEGLTVKAAASPSVNIASFRNSTNSNLVWIDSAFGLHVNSISTVISDNPSLEVVNYNSSTGYKENIYCNLTLTGTSAAAAQYAFYSVVSSSRSAGNISVMDALYFQAAKGGAGTVSAMNGVDGLATNSGTGSISSMVGLSATTSSTGAAAITTVAGISYSHSQSAGTITSLYGINIADITAAGGTITNLYGIYINNITVGGTLNFSIFTNDGIASFGDHVKIRTDNDKLYFGTGDDFTITYDGTDAVIDPQAVGTGLLSILSGIRLESKAGTATDGDFWNDSTQKSLQTFVDGVEQTMSTALFVQTATKNINTSASEVTLTNTGVGTLTLPANFFVAGKTIRVKATCFASTTGTPTIRTKIKLGSVIMLDSTAIAVGAALTNNLIDIEGIITCYTTGASGTFWSQGRSDIKPGAATGINFWQMVNTATVAVDTTASQAIDVTFQWGTSSASNTVTCTNLVVEVLN